MPVIMVNSLELLDYQKKNIAKKMTQVLAHETNVPEEMVYVFFGSYPLSSIAAGGVLNSDVPVEILKNFITKDTEILKHADYLYVIRSMKAKYGQEEKVKKDLTKLLYQARAAEGCKAFDFYQSNLNMKSGRLEQSCFIIKEVWEDQAHKERFEASDTYQAFETSSETLRRVTPFDGIVGQDYSDKIFVSQRITIGDHFKEKAKHELIELALKLKEKTGCLVCDVYQTVNGYDTNSVFIVDQIWEDSKKLYAAEIMEEHSIIKDVCTLSEPVETIIYNRVSSQVEHLSMNAVLGDPQLMAGLVKLNDDFGELCINASSVPWGKPLIDQKTKVLIAIAVDVVEQITGKPFENHIHMALQQGITREELEELMLFMTIYAGFNKAGIFYSELNRIFG